MDSIVKQRLVGALILLALAVVFWPIIFVPEAQREAPVVVEVPAAPPVDLTPLPEPDNLGLKRGGAAAVQQQDAPDVEAPGSLGAGEAPPSLPSSDDVAPVPDLAAAEAELASPEMDEDGLPIAYTLQVATMADAARAEALRDALVAAGYKGYLKRLRRDDRTLYRVLVGPRYTEAELEPMKAAIDETWRVDSLIMRYFP